jgi:broad-specificity NMP kinase
LKRWWEENKDYLYWDKQNKRFITDKAAKKNRIVIDPHSRLPLDKNRIIQLREVEKKLAEVIKNKSNIRYKIHSNMEASSPDSN